MDGERVLRVATACGEYYCYCYLGTTYWYQLYKRARRRAEIQTKNLEIAAQQGLLRWFLCLLVWQSLYQRPATAPHCTQTNLPGAAWWGSPTRPQLKAAHGMAHCLMLLPIMPHYSSAHPSLSRLIAHRSALAHHPVLSLLRRAMAEAGRRCSPTRIPLCQNKYLFWLCPRSAITSSCKAARVVITGVACFGRHKPQWRQSAHVRPC
jgi:hypothetical protein